MADPKHWAKLREGVQAWNQWRTQNPDIKPDLGGAGLSGANLGGADLNYANLLYTDLIGANLIEATFIGARFRGDLSKAKLIEADLRQANLYFTNLSEADLRKAKLAQAKLYDAKLIKADLREADLSEADLSGANLSRAVLVETNLEKAVLTSCFVYGISVWNVRLKGAIQSNLVITPVEEAAIQVDNLQVAQFVYLLLNNEEIRHVIDTITSKMVLILGRFTPERKVILDAIREELRKRDYLPVLFDFEKPASKDLTGTVSTLANLARFVIADLTDPSTVPHELAMVAPGTVVPIQTILLEGQREYAMFGDLKSRYHWVLTPYQYKSKDLLIPHLDGVIAPAEAKAAELARSS